MKNIIAVLTLLGLSTKVFAANGPAAPQGSPMGSIIMLVVFFAIFYFLLIRPQMKRTKEQRKMIDALAKGDEVVTTGGVAGKITKLGDHFVDVNIADNIEIKVQKNAITTVLPKGTLKSS